MSKLKDAEDTRLKVKLQRLNKGLGKKAGSKRKKAVNGDFDCDSEPDDV